MPFPALSLNISKNLPKIKAKEVGHVMEAIVNLIQVLNDKCSILLFFWKNTDYLFLSFSGGRVLPAEVELVRLQTEDGHQQRDQCSWVQPVSSGDPDARIVKNKQCRDM